MVVKYFKKAKVWKNIEGKIEKKTQHLVFLVPTGSQHNMNKIEEQS